MVAARRVEKYRHFVLVLGGFMGGWRGWDACDLCNPLVPLVL
jgi:hypothetical protein